MKNPKFSPWLAALLAMALFCAGGCTRQAKVNRHLKRANSYFAADQYDRAEIEYLNVLRIQGTNRVAIRNLAQIYYTDEAYRRAGSLLSAAKGVDPTDMESRGRLAR